MAPGDIGGDPPRLNSDTSQTGGSGHTEEKYEHTIRKDNKKTPVSAPRLWSGVGDDA